MSGCVQDQGERQLYVTKPMECIIEMPWGESIHAINNATLIFHTI